jgi:hypothetical protein
MGLKPVPKEAKRIADEQEKAAAQTLILETAKPPEKSVFSNNWKLIAGTIVAGTAIAAVAMTVAASKKKNGHQE